MATEKQDFVHQVFDAEENSAKKLDDSKISGYKYLAAKMFNTQVLRPKEMLYPALASFAGNIVGGIGTYQTLFFVSVLRIDMLYVAAIRALISIWDALNNPLMGIVYDKTRTRWGKARPYMIFTPIPYFLSTAVLYCGGLLFNNADTADPKKIIFLFVTLFVQETFATIYGIPRNNILSLMTPNPKDRITMGVLNQYANDFGAGIVYTLFMPIQDLNRWGVTNISMQSLFAFLGIFAAVFGSFANMALAIGTRERILLQQKPAPITKSLFYILKNKYAMRNFAAEFATSWFGTGGYSWDLVTQLEIIGGAFKSTLVYMPNTIVRNISIAMVPKIMKLFKHNIRNGVITFRLLDIGRSFIQYFMGNMWIDKPLLFSLQFAFWWMLNGLDDAPAMVFEAEMDREINDYTEYVTGERPDGTFNLIKDLINRITSPLGALFTVAVFKWTGYDSTKPMTYFSQGNIVTYKRLYFLYMFGWSIPAIVKLIPLFFYDITGDKREVMYMKLNARRALIADEKKNEMSDEMQAIVGMLADDKQPAGGDLK
ncbi:MAG: MFS transporter [Clostridiales bacterium]|nr:MFS transporter [Clostridiales bacterium]